MFTKKPIPLTDVKGSSYGPTIKAQLDEERARKTSLEGRGIGIVTSSGALATLLFGLATFTRGTITQAHLTLTPAAKWSLIAAAGLFALAAIAGVLSNLPLPYNEALVSALKDRTRLAEWNKTEPIEAARYDAELNVEILDSARDRNGLKAAFLFAGILLEAVAAVAVGIAVYAEVSGL